MVGMALNVALEIFFVGLLGLSVVAIGFLSFVVIWRLFRGRERGREE